MAINLLISLSPFAFLLLAAYCERKDTLRSLSFAMFAAISLLWPLVLIANG